MGSLATMSTAVGSISAMYAGPIAQQVFDQMQADMDKIAQGDLFGETPAVGGIKLVPTDEERCMEWRKHYFEDMTGAVGFEKFQDTYTFTKGYSSEDPHESFLLPPSKTAFDAFLQF